MTNLELLYILNQWKLAPEEENKLNKMLSVYGLDYVHHRTKNDFVDEFKALFNKCYDIDLQYADKE